MGAVSGCSKARLQRARVLATAGQAGFGRPRPRRTAQAPCGAPTACQGPGSGWQAGVGRPRPRRMVQVCGARLQRARVLAAGGQAGVGRQRAQVRQAVLLARRARVGATGVCVWVEGRLHAEPSLGRTPLQYSTDALCMLPLESSFAVAVWQSCSPRQGASADTASARSAQQVPFFDTKAEEHSASH